MFDVFGDVLERLYAAQHQVISIDNGVAKLHYRITFWLLLACTALVCSRQYFGEHIHCMVDAEVPEHVINTFCFFSSTYTLWNGQRSEIAHEHYAYPGVSPHFKDETIIHHAYYQWVPFVLFGQAFLFYLPRLIWKTYEGGTIRNMVEGLQRLYLRSPDDSDKQMNGYHIYSTKTMSDKTMKLHKQFQTISRFRLNRYWGLMLIFCEFLNLLNVVIQLCALDRFLGGNFLNLGRRILSGDPYDNPFEQVFPKMTKCDFHMYGPSGAIQVFDAMCLMALNTINEKIYAVLWFWFIFLIPISLLVLLWRIVSLLLYSRSERFNHYLLKETTGMKLNPVDVAIVTRQSCYADWILLYYLSSNIDGPIFIELLHNLATDLGRAPKVATFDDVSMTEHGSRVIVTP